MVRSPILGSYRLEHQRRLDLLFFIAVPAVHVAAGLGPAEIARRMQRTVAAIRVRTAKINAGAGKS